MTTHPTPQTDASLSANELRAVAAQLEWYANDCKGSAPAADAIPCIDGHSNEETYELYAVKALRQLAALQSKSAQPVRTFTDEDLQREQSKSYWQGRHDAEVMMSPDKVSEEAVNRVALILCEQDGVEDAHQLLYQGNPPEPWGEAWNEYEPQAKQIVEAVAPLLSHPAKEVAQPTAFLQERAQLEQEWCELRALKAATVALPDKVLRYVMAAMGTGSPADAERFRVFWFHAQMALGKSHLHTSAPPSAASDEYAIALQRGIESACSNRPATEDTRRLSPYLASLIDAHAQPSAEKPVARPLFGTGRLIECAVQDDPNARDFGWLYIKHVAGQWVSAAKLQPFSLSVLRKAGSIE